MASLEIVSPLIDLHKDLFKYAIQNSQGKTNIPLFSIQAPGHIGTRENIQLQNFVRLNQKRKYNFAFNPLTEDFHTRALSWLP